MLVEIEENKRMGKRKSCENFANKVAKRVHVYHELTERANRESGVRCGEGRESGVEGRRAEVQRM